MDREWASKQLEAFVEAIDQLDQLGRIGHLVADSESQMLKLENDADETDNMVRSHEPIVQLIMEAVEPGSGSTPRMGVGGRSADVGSGQARNAPGPKAASFMRY